MSCKDNYKDSIPNKQDKDFVRCKPKSRKPKEILLECGDGTGRRTFTSSNDVPFQLAHVTLDTRFLKKPEVLIKFSSLVRMDAFEAGATVRLQYELFRVCEGEDPKSLGTWMFEEVGSALAVFETQEETFSFIFCETINCSKCSEYFVTVTPMEIVSASATVSNGRIAALSQALCDSIKEEYKNYDAENNDIKPKIKSRRAKNVLLTCGQGNGSVTYRQETIFQSPVTIAHVVVDTSCLTSPEVLIEFSSVINTAFRVNDVKIEFELFRACSDGEPLPLGNWIFERINNVIPTAIDNAFSFVYCEKVSCQGCCEYFVTVKGLELNVSDPAIYLGITVDNARITAIAQSSKGDFHDNACKIYDRKNSCHECIIKSPKPKGIILECGMGTGNRTFNSSSDSVFQLAHTAIDTTSLCKPIVNIEFSSIVSFQNLVDQGRAQLRYELFRVCDGREPVSLGIWFISRIDFRIIDKSTNSFDFTFCDCRACPGCCEYFVTVTPVELTEGFITATVSNGSMAVLAQEC